MSEERDPYLNKEEDIRMDDTREKHWRDVADEVIIRRIFIPQGGRYMLIRIRS